MEERTASSLNPLTWMRRTYDWVLAVSKTRFAMPGLALVAFAEAIVFPVPPDIMLITMVLADRSVVWRATITSTVASVSGGIVAYAVGFWAMDTVGTGLVEALGAQEAFASIEATYHAWGFWAVFGAGFTPIPYKVFTLAAGAVQLSFPAFVFASLLSRGLRYAIVAGAVYKWGAKAQEWIDRWFSQLTLVALAILLLLVWLVRS